MRHRVRRSTALLGAVFVATSVLYVLVRPAARPSTGTSGNPAPAVTTTVPPTTPPTVTVLPTTSQPPA